MSIPMVKIEGVPDSESVKPGMAFFAGTGPIDKTCGDCKFRGYTRESKNGVWSESQRAFVYKSYRVQGCMTFRNLTGHSGPAVDKAWRSCKYFEQKKK